MASFHFENFGFLEKIRFLLFGEFFAHRVVRADHEHRDTFRAFREKRIFENDFCHFSLKSELFCAGKRAKKIRENILPRFCAPSFNQEKHFERRKNRQIRENREKF